jgi:ribosomal protein L9
MFKKTLIVILCLVCVTNFLHSQNVAKLINESETERIEKYLSSDELAGRQIYTAGIEMAAKFIANEFKQNGLATFKNSDSHLQSFSRISTKFISAAGNFDGNNIDTKNIIAITSEPNLDINEKSGYEVVKIAKEDNLFLTVRKYMTNNKNYVILVDEALGANFGRLVQFKSGLSEQQKSIFIVLTNQTPTQYN